MVRVNEVKSKGDYNIHIDKHGNKISHRAVFAYVRSNSSEYLYRNMSFRVQSSTI